MRFLEFLSVSSTVTVATVAIGLALTGQPEWHFTVLDVVLDAASGAFFGILAQVLSIRLSKNRIFNRAAIIVTSGMLGILATLVIEGGAARALIFGS